MSNLKVSVLIPCRNEIESIKNCLDNVMNFDSPDGGYEVIVMDGMSDDGTRDIISEKIKHYQNLRMIDNDRRTIPHAMNLGIREAMGEYIIRTDVRCVHPEDYLKALIALSEETEADNVGGVLEPDGRTVIQQGIALAYRSPIAMGGALRDRGGFVGESDAVYGGCWRRERLVEIGMYDESMIKNEDDELSFRLRKAGGKVMQSGAIKVIYYPRRKFSQLFKQFLQYGYWKVPVLRRHPKQASLRHLGPTALVLFFIALVIGSLFYRVGAVALLAYTVIYLVIISIESIRLSFKERPGLSPLVCASISIIHAGYGSGFFIGLVCSLFNLRPMWFEGLTR